MRSILDAAVDQIHFGNLDSRDESENGRNESLLAAIRKAFTARAVWYHSLIACAWDRCAISLPSRLSGCRNESGLQRRRERTHRQINSGSKSDGDNSAMVTSAWESPVGGCRLSVK